MRYKTGFGSSHPSPRHPSASPLPHYMNSPAPSTPRRLFKRPFPPPSPAKHIQSSLVKRHGAKPKEGGTIPEAVDNEKPLDKLFGYPKNFTSKYELGHEVGRGHFGHTCYAKTRRGEHKGMAVAVKIISKAKVLLAFVYISPTSCVDILLFFGVPEVTGEWFRRGSSAFAAQADLLVAAGLQIARSLGGGRDWERSKWRERSWRCLEASRIGL